MRLDPSHLSIAEFREACMLPAPPTPHALGLERGVPLYAASDLVEKLCGPARASMLDEWAQVLGQGAGVFVIKGAYGDTAIGLFKYDLE